MTVCRLIKYPEGDKVAAKSQRRAIKRKLLIETRNKCEICRNIIVTGPEDFKDSNLDHDHKSGFVRGVLCDNCNIMLGLVKDNPDILYNAISYLKNFNQLLVEAPPQSVQPLE